MGHLNLVLLVLGFTQLMSVIQSKYIPPGPRYSCPDKPLLLYPCTCTESGDMGVKVRCENTNIATMSIGLSNLANIRAPIEELTFSKCSIGKLYGSALYTLHVRVLRIKDTPLTFIEPHTFQGINRTLQELYITGSKLNKFPADAFKILGNLTTLNIDGHEFSYLAKNAFSGGMIADRLERLHITNGLLSDLPPEALAPLRKLKTLDLHGNHLKELKRNQFKGLRDTEVLDLSYNNLTKIDASHLSDLTKLSWCNISNNDITELTRGTFARNTVLRVLNMRGNKLKKLDSNSFRGMRFIRRLYFSDNQISDIGRGTFGSITRVGTIDLARNKITKIDYQMFYQLNYVEIIDVSENEVTEIQKLAFKDLYLVKINVSHNVISKIESGAFENCANITLLDMSHNRIASIPKSAFDPTTYATEFLLSHNLLTDLSQVPLHNMTGLKILNASYNNIETIPRNTFPKLYELHTIDLSHNKIKDIWNTVFQSLFSLRSLNLSHNSLEVVKSSTFGALHTLLELDLSHNKLKDVNRASMARLASLRTMNLRNNSISQLFQLPISLSHLDLSYNSISEIVPLKTWPTMNSLLSLDISYNLLNDSLQQGAFTNLLTLQRLNLAGNNITQPPWECLADLTTLQYLYLQDNQLTHLSKGAFGRLPIVFELNLANNQISNVSVRAFEGLLQLLTLNLTANNISSIPNGAFQGLVSLRTLDLSHNYIDKLDNKTNSLLEDCLSLEKVNLSHNKISFITRKTFPSSPWVPYRIKEIDLSYNVMPVLTYDITVGTHKLEVLNVSHNLLNEVRKNVLGNLTALKVLDMSYNQLSNFPKNIFGPPPNLTMLYLSNNKFDNLPLQELVTLKSQLKLVDARNNELIHFNDELMTLVENGTEVLFESNPLECDCLARPLRRWMSSQTTLPNQWKQIMCYGPEFLVGHPLFEVKEERMTCLDKSVVSSDPKFSISPDIKFRNIQRTEGGDISATWYVTTHDDVGDFYIIVRDVKGKEEKSSDRKSQSTLVYEQDIPYTERGHVVKSESLRESQGKLELCILARDSEGNVRKWRNSQCKVLSDDSLSSSSSIQRFSANMIIFTLSSVLFLTMRNNL